MRSEGVNKGFCLLTFNNDQEADYFISQVKEKSFKGRPIGIKQRYFQFDS